MGGRPRISAGARKVVLGELPEIAAPNLSWGWQRANYSPCAQCPDGYARRKKREKQHGDVSKWFDAPFIRQEYFRPLAQLFESLASCASLAEVSEITKKGGGHAHGRRDPADLTVVGRCVFAHAGLDDDVLAGSLFRFRVTDTARIWALVDEGQHVEWLFWDPHHYLGDGHAYAELPWEPRWEAPPGNGAV